MKAFVSGSRELSTRRSWNALSLLTKKHTNATTTSMGTSRRMLSDMTCAPSSPVHLRKYSFVANISNENVGAPTHPKHSACLLVEPKKKCPLPHEPSITSLKGAITTCSSKHKITCRWDLPFRALFNTASETRSTSKYEAHPNNLATRDMRRYLARFTIRIPGKRCGWCLKFPRESCGRTASSRPADGSSSSKPACARGRGQ